MTEKLRIVKKLLSKLIGFCSPQGEEDLVWKLKSSEKPLSGSGFSIL